MATIVAPQASAGVQPPGLRVGVVSRTSTWSLNGSTSNGDVIQMLKVPANAQVTDIQLSFRAAGVGSFVVGDGIDPDRYIIATAASAGIGFTRMNATAFAPYTYSVDDTIDVTLSNSTNFSAGAIYMIATINMNPTV